MTLKEAYDETTISLERALNHPSYKEDPENPIFKMAEERFKKLEKIEIYAKKHGWNANKTLFMFGSIHL